MPSMKDPSPEAIANVTEENVGTRSHLLPEERAVEGDLDPAAVVPGTCELEWPRGSGRILVIPEIDRVAWFDLAEAYERIVPGQRAFLDRLRERVVPAVDGT